jgi:hypothetical protein
VEAMGLVVLLSLIFVALLSFAASSLLGWLLPQLKQASASAPDNR